MVSQLPHRPLLPLVKDAIILEPYTCATGLFTVAAPLEVPTCLTSKLGPLPTRRSRSHVNSGLLLSMLTQARRERMLLKGQRDRTYSTQ